MEAAGSSGVTAMSSTSSTALRRAGWINGRRSRRQAGRCEFESHPRHSRTG